jgi:hypothetical protein
MAAWVASVARLDGEEVLGLVGTAVRIGHRAAVLPAGWSGVSARRRLSRIGDPLPGPVVVLAGDPLRVLADDDLLPVAVWGTGAPLRSPAHVVADACTRLVPPPTRAGEALDRVAHLVAATPTLDVGQDGAVAERLGEFFLRNA